MTKSRYGQLFRFCGHLVDAEEIQLMVDSANYCLMVDSAIQYGLLAVTGEDGKPLKDQSSGVNVERCLQVVERGKQMGYVPNEDYLIQQTA